MRAVQLSVRLLAKPEVDYGELFDWVNAMGGFAWVERINDDGAAPIDAELVAEVAGRRCYQSWAPGINANVTKVREDSDEYLKNILRVRHGSVLEHGMFTFALEGISRVVTHELVRHRVGVAISQESLRYVRLTDIPFRIPEWIEADEVLSKEAHSLLSQMENFQVLMAERAGIDDPDKDFHFKKTVTSDMRRFAPIGLLTGMVWSANVRTLRFLLETRTAEGAEREIRDLFDKVGRVMLEECPSLFSDFKQVPVEGSSVPAWVPESSKV